MTTSSSDPSTSRATIRIGHDDGAITAERVANQEQHIDAERNQENADLGQRRPDHDAQIRSYSTRSMPAVAPQM